MSMDTAVWHWGSEVVRMAALVGILVPLYGCAEKVEGMVPKPSAPIFDKLIVPGTRIGPVALDMNERELFSALGDPQKSTIDERGPTVYYYSDFHVWVDRGRVSQIVTTDTEFTTPDQINVGASDLSVRAKLGPPDRVDRDSASSRFVSYCYKPGIYFEFDRGQLFKIYVWRPGGCK